MTNETNSKFAVISEIMFVILPLVIIIIYYLLKGNGENILYKSEWTFATIVFFGQSIVKFISGLLKSHRKFKWQNIAFIISLIITLGLIPSSIILILMLQLQEPNSTLLLFQYILFLLSILVYYYFGSTAQVYFDEDLKTITKNAR